MKWILNLFCKWFYLDSSRNDAWCSFLEMQNHSPPSSPHTGSGTCILMSSLSHNTCTIKSETLPGVGYGLTKFSFKGTESKYLGFIVNIVCAEVTQLKHQFETLLADNS